MDHPAVSTFQDLVAALSELAPFGASVGPSPMGLRITADGGALLALDAACMTTPLADRMPSAHHKLALAAVAARLDPLARAWHRACAMVPGLTPLCGEGTLFVSFFEGPMALSWQPAESLWGDSRPPPPVAGIAPDFARRIAAAVGAAPHTSAALAPHTFFHPHYHMPDLCGVETTAEVARAMAPMIYAESPLPHGADAVRIGSNGDTFLAADLLESDPWTRHPWDRAAYQKALHTFEALRAFVRWVEATRPDALAWGSFESGTDGRNQGVRFATAELRDVLPHPDGPDGALGAWVADAIAAWEACIAAIPPTATWHLHRQMFRLFYERDRAAGLGQVPLDSGDLARTDHRHSLHLHDGESVDHDLPLSRVVPWLIPREGPLWWVIVDHDAPEVFAVRATQAREAAHWALSLAPPLHPATEIQVWRQVA